MGLPEVLMVAEKPSIASSIASILSKGNHKTRSGKLPVHFFEGKFLNQTVQFKVYNEMLKVNLVGNIGCGTCLFSRFCSRISELGKDRLLGFVFCKDHSQRSKWERSSSFERDGKECVSSLYKNMIV